MLGKASEFKITDALRGPGSVRTWQFEYPDCIVLDIKTTADKDADYFFIIYKEAV